MATEVATLQFRADTSDLSRASARLRDVQRSADGAEAANEDYRRSQRRTSRDTRENTQEQSRYNRALRSVGASAKGNAIALAGMAASLATVGASVKIISVAREFDKINASLKTMTGSEEAASKAFGRIQEFATTTPYDLAQVATAFTKLTALGLNPSQEALTSYGNTAAAMGKDLNQMIEAVADAATGEFERLKEFGIRASSQGDEVSLTFQGVTTTIGKNAAEIEAYLMGLGQVQFAGAMAERAATLDGAISNLGDSWDNLFLTLSQAGVGQYFEDVARSTTELLNNLGVMIRLSNGTATATEQLAAAEDELALLEAKKAGMSELAFSLLQDRYNAQVELVASLKQQVALEAELATKEEERAQQLYQLQEIDTAYIEKLKEKGAAYTEDANKAKIAADARVQAAKESAQAELAEMMQLNETRIQETFRIEQERIAYMQSLRDQDLISEEEYQAAKTEIERAALEERLELLEADLASRDEAKRISAENDRLLEEAQAEAKGKRSEVLNDRLLAAEDLLMKGKSEKQKEGFRTAVNIFNQEKRENAKKIISSSYTAAMDAYKALAGIPYIGPALGAAAFATVMATGLQAARDSLAGRALGGQVRAGESYVVGERGPEVLTMGSSGSIMPNEALRAGSSAKQSPSSSPQLNVQVQNFGTSQISVERISETDVRIIAREIAQQTVRTEAPQIVARDIQNANGRVSRSLSQNIQAQRRR